MAITAARLMVEIGANPEAAVRGINSAQNAVNGFVQKVGGSGFRDIFAGVFGANLAMGAVQGLRNTTGEALNAYTAYERLSASMVTLQARELRSTNQTLSMGQALKQAAPNAQALLNWIEKLAIESPFSQAGVADAFRTAQAYGFATDESQRLTQAMLDYAAGAGVSEGAMGQTVLALGQIQARGKLAAQEINQLVNAGIPVRQILAEAFGVTTAELMEMSEKGLIPANVAIEAIVSSIENDFGGAAKRQTETMGGLITSLEDLKQIGLREFFTGTFQEIQPYLDRFVTKLQDPEFRANLRAMGADFGEGVRELAEGAQSAITWYVGLDEGVKKLILSLGGLVVLGPTVVGMLGDVASAGFGLARGLMAIPGILGNIQTGINAWRAGLSLTTALGAAGISSMTLALGGFAIAAAGAAAAWALVHKQAETQDAFEANAKQVASTAKTYGEYSRAMETAARANGQMIDAEGNLVGVQVFGNQVRQGVIEQNFRMSEAMWYRVKAAEAARIAQEMLANAEENPNAENNLEAMLAEAEAANALAEAEAEAAQAAEDQAAAIKEAAAAAREATIAYWNMAEGLKGAGSAEIAKAQIGLLQESLKEGRISTLEYTEAVQNIGMAFGLMDNRSLALTEGLNRLRGGLEGGVLPAEKMDEAVKALIADAADGKTDIEAIMNQFAKPPLMELPNERLPGQMSGNLAAGLKESLGGAVEEGMSALVTETEKQAGLAAASAKNAFAEPNWTEIGLKISQGVATGIKQGAPGITKAAQEAAWAAYLAAKEKLGIKSPSKVAMEIGYQFVAGQVGGIRQGERHMVAAATRSAERMAAAAAMARPQNAQSYSGQPAASGPMFNLYGGELHLHNAETGMLYESALEQMSPRV